MTKEWQAGLHRISVNPSEISRKDLLLNEKKGRIPFFYMTSGFVCAIPGFMRSSL